MDGRDRLQEMGVYLSFLVGRLEGEGGVGREEGDDVEEERVDDTAEFADGAGNAEFVLRVEGDKSRCGGGDAVHELEEGLDELFNYQSLAFLVLPSFLPSITLNLLQLNHNGDSRSNTPQKPTAGRCRSPPAPLSRATTLYPQATYQRCRRTPRRRPAAPRGSWTC
jgi:hypothetical protein